jgi:hypothetical protein
MYIPSYIEASKTKLGVLMHMFYFFVCLIMHVGVSLGFHVQF